jgi:hypothetical protein
MCIVGILLALTTKSATPAGLPVAHNPALAFAAAGIALVLGGANAQLGERISRRSGGSRQTVIVVECLMACFGAVLCLLTANLDGGLIPFCAGFAGGILSLTAAIWLTRPPARQYFATPRDEFTPSNPLLRPGDGDQKRPFTINAQSRCEITVPLACL